MDVKNTQQNINVNNAATKNMSSVQKSSDVKFSDELKNVKQETVKDENMNQDAVTEEKLNENNVKKEESDKKAEIEADTKLDTEPDTKPDETLDEKLNVIPDTEIDKKINEIKPGMSENKIDEKQEDIVINNAIDGLQVVVNEFNKIGQKDELENNIIKPDSDFDDKRNKISNEENNLIDNNMNIQEPSEKLNVQTEANMNFNSSEQPFSQFVNQDKSKDILKSNAAELAEEKSILSTMEENIAIANKNMLLKKQAAETEETTNVKENKTQTVQNETGIKKVDTKTHIVVDTIVSYENVVMDKADVDFFVNLVENGAVNLSEIQHAEKSSQVSKTLADLLAKAMNDNKPVRIDFDNDISIIIKIDRAGKISADFLPSSQIAEAYLKENLPLLKQRFDDNNIDYNELNQRKQQKQQDSQEDNRKKGRKNE